MPSITTFFFFFWVIHHTNIHKYNFLLSLPHSPPTPSETWHHQLATTVPHVLGRLKTILAMADTQWNPTIREREREREREAYVQNYSSWHCIENNLFFFFFFCCCKIMNSNAKPIVEILVKLFSQSCKSFRCSFCYHCCATCSFIFTVICCLFHHVLIMWDS